MTTASDGPVGAAHEPVMVGVDGGVAAPPADRSDAIVRAARSWIDTPFVHQGDVLGVGVDCVMLVVRVYSEAGVLPPDFPDPRPYPRGWYLERGDTRYRDALAAHFVQARGPLVNDCPVHGRRLEPQCSWCYERAPQPGDLVLFRVGKAAAHSGIVTAWPYVVHAYPERAVCEEPSDRNALAEHPIVSVWRPR